MVRAMVHSTKHYVQQSLFTVLASATKDENLASAVAVSDKNTVEEVVEGSTVKAVYVELWLRTQSTSPGSFVFIVCKRPGGVNSPTTTDMGALGVWDNKKNILYTTQGLINDQDADAIAVFKGWIKIPKSKQRMGLGDKISWHLFAQGALDMTGCGFSTYKEYT